jgi:hypothetical protein
MKKTKKRSRASHEKIMGQKLRRLGQKYLLKKITTRQYDDGVGKIVSESIKMRKE